MLPTMSSRRKEVERDIRSFGASAGRWLGGASYLKKWLALGMLIGVVAGLGAVAFYFILSHATQFLLIDIGGYAPPTPIGDGGAAGAGGAFSAYTRPWAIPLVVALGALLSAALVFTLEPEAEGHGTDAAIDAIHKNPRQIRVRTVVVKIIASGLTIGSGGSGGREGPTAQISAGFASLLTRFFDLKPSDGRIAVAVGIGSGIGAIFGAPLGGAVLAASIAYRNDIDERALVPGFITSITAYAVFGSIEGYQPLFGNVAQDYQFDDPVQLLWFAVIGILAGFVGLAYSRTFYGVMHLTKRLPGNNTGGRILKATIGGLLVGLMALAIPQVLGSGYGWAQHALDRTELLAIPLWLVIILPLAKILATSLSIGTGGSGGIFGPGVVIGAFTGGAVWRVLEVLDAPAVPESPAPFVIVGMMACFGSVARVPLAVMLMVAEMTGSYTIMVPAMVAVGLAYLIVRQAGDSIYVKQVDSREDEYSARLAAGLPMLDRVSVATAMTAPRVVLMRDSTCGEAAATMRDASVPGAPVVHRADRFVGAVRLAEVEAADPGTPLRRLVDPTVPTVPVGDNLDDALDAMHEGHGWLTVLDADRKVRGVLAMRDIVNGYRSAVVHDVERFESIGTNVGVRDVTVAAKSELVGLSLGPDSLPEGLIVLTVLRANEVLQGSSALQFEEGDVVTLLGQPDDLEAVGLQFSGGSRQ